MLANNSRPIIVVTGANTGVGFGICHRIIFQLTTGRREGVSSELEVECNGLTLILACRSKQRAEAAQAKLYEIADQLVRQAKQSPNYNGHAEVFRKDLHIAVHLVDLADTHSIFRFTDEISKGYPYVSHLICNAGVARFKEINWHLAIYQLLTDWISALSRPRFYGQHVGDMSQDGLGWVWQCNVFGHYVLFRLLEPLLAKYAAATGARVVWISSHEASFEFYDPKDWQLVKTNHSYECSKYQMNMISLYLDREAIRGQLDDRPAIRHLRAYPGVAGTNIASAILGTFTSLLMFISFYIARFLGSTDHTIDVFKAAVSAVDLSFVPLARPRSVSGTVSSGSLKESVEESVIYVSQTDRWGREYSQPTKLVLSQEEGVQTKELLEKCDQLLKTFRDIQGRTSIAS